MTRYIHDANGVKYTPNQYRTAHRNVHFSGWPSVDYLASVGASIVEVDEPEPVPHAVSMRQARLALSRSGLLANAESAIASMTGAAGDEARIEWEYATALRRDHPLVAALGQTLGLDDAAKDDLFRQAAQIL